MKVLDAGAFIEGLMVKGITTPEVTEETKVPFGTEIRPAKKEFLKKAKEAAKRTGDLSVLSPADLSIIALALETGAELVTNDFAVQNTAKSLGITLEIGSKEIKKEIWWEWYCPACHAKYGEKKICDICGTETKRRPKNRRKQKGASENRKSL